MPCTSAIRRICNGSPFGYAAANCNKFNASSTYTLTASDIGYRFYVTVAAYNTISAPNRERAKAIMEGMNRERVRAGEPPIIGGRFELIEDEGPIMVDHDSKGMDAFNALLPALLDRADPLTRGLALIR